MVHYSLMAIGDYCWFTLAITSIPRDTLMDDVGSSLSCLPSPPPLWGGSKTPKKKKKKLDTRVG